MYRFKNWIDRLKFLSTILYAVEFRNTHCARRVIYNSMVELTFHQIIINIMFFSLKFYTIIDISKTFFAVYFSVEQVSINNGA